MKPSSDHDCDDVQAHQTRSGPIEAKLLVNCVPPGGIDHQATEDVKISTNKPVKVQRLRVFAELSKSSFANVLVMNIVVLIWFLHVLWTGQLKDWTLSDMIQIPPLWQNKINMLTRRNQNWNEPVSSKTNTNINKTNQHDKTKFQHSTVPVVQSRTSFPSFLDYRNGKQEKNSPLVVSYDGRSLMLNGERIFLLGGSIHPGWRVTQLGWEHALDEAVRQGLNLITFYIFWNSHQVYPDDEIDWNFPTRSIPHPSDDNDGNDDDDTEWSLASAIRSAAKRGLFVHIRIGPYACAEYNNGGIPEWLSLQHPNMVFRSFDLDWMNAMEQFLNETVTYLRSHQLWAYQGGNIILAQVENELPWSQLYADWSGTVAQQLEPQVTWTMCNGLSAPNTILTCNCIGGGCSQFLESHGDNGRIQRDMPALLTEFEGGFQTWGETSDHPSAYFWGINARTMARHALKWFARGGSHLNHYMWQGGYNRGKSAGNGITNMYASDVSLCSSGERHEPKYSHFQDMHRALADVAQILLDSPSALSHSHIVEYWNNETGTWQAGSEQRLFVYPPPAETAGASMTSDAKDVVIFLENDSGNEVLVRIPTWGMVNSKNSNDNLQMQSLLMAPASAMLLVNGNVRFDSAAINPKHMKFQRRINPTVANLLQWSVWPEPIGASVNDSQTIPASRPKEQTALNIEGKAADSDYAWYETDFVLNASATRGALYIDSRTAMAFVVYVDGVFVGAVHDIDTNRFGNVTIPMDMTVALSAGSHTLALLSESLGYHNTATGSQQAKTKGITGNVLLVTYNGPGDVWHDDGRNQTTIETAVQSLVDGREWRSFPGLHGSSQMLQSSKIGTKKARTQAQIERSLGDGEQGGPLPMSSPPTWSSALFRTPDYDPTTSALFLQITRGRGHLWLNGNDLGRYWNITRGDTGKYSQQFYFLPHDFLYKEDSLNEILLFDALGGNVDDDGSTVSVSNSSRRLVLSWIEASSTPRLKDEVDFPSACL